MPQVANGTPLPDRVGEAKAAEGALEHRPDAVPLRGSQALAREQVASVLIGDRQRIAVDPVLGSVVSGGKTPGC
ncbi:MAG: hypothetical protein ACRDTT_29820 [Pseudonocardiaceae bacterium]